mmetsp:Transcript_31939/g.69117  ORF Transcript_31939/g.69117 Transcript_31939/m.69117 type:complete len:399 (+) Transcript_31939:278-1474(+)
MVIPAQRNQPLRNRPLFGSLYASLAIAGVASGFLFSSIGCQHTSTLSQQHHRRVSLTMSSSCSTNGLSWSPLADLIDSHPKDVASSHANQNAPRLAKDEDFAASVQKHWKAEVDTREARAIGAPITYQTSQGVPLYGYAVRPASGLRFSAPGILIFHTAAGPQGIFLRWKAESIATDPELGGCVVLIADILSDDIGWAWDSDRRRYNNVRDEVLASTTDAEGLIAREELQRRIQASVDALSSLEGVDANRLGAVGFCMGGLPCLEISRMNISGMRAIATFHGVFDAVEDEESPGRQEDAVGNAESATESTSSIAQKPHALICHGGSDPFVKAEELKACERIFRRNGWEWELLKFDDARHGFTNPAQDFNPSDAFAFDEQAATLSWTAACSLMRRKLAL